jgi:hypothetical protein
MSIAPEKRKLTPSNEPAQSIDSQLSIPETPVSSVHDIILQPLPEELRLREQELQEIEADDILAAKTAMDHKQYRRAISYLENKKSAKAIYMARYSEFLVGSSSNVHAQTVHDDVGLRSASGKRLKTGTGLMVSVFQLLNFYKRD